jgi:hypothetical protein
MYNKRFKIKYNSMLCYIYLLYSIYKFIRIVVASKISVHRRKEGNLLLDSDQPLSCAGRLTSGARMAFLRGQSYLLTAPGQTTGVGKGNPPVKRYHSSKITLMKAFKMG